MSDVRCCAVVPTLDNAATIRSVVERIRTHLPDVLVIDDGSATAGRRACEALHREGLAEVVRFERNRGKGTAVRHGLALAADAGFGHAFQIDADGQHDIDRIPAFLDAARRTPGAAVLGYPIYDDSVPRSRLVARRLTKFWVDVEVGGRGLIRDAMVGFRIYPVAETLALRLSCRRMAFDVEAAVQLAWAGVPLVNLPVGIRYLRPEEGGRSHFRPIRDNVHISWLHSRLCTVASIRWCLRRLGAPALASRS